MGQPQLSLPDGFFGLLHVISVLLPLPMVSPYGLSMWSLQQDIQIYYMAAWGSQEHTIVTTRPQNWSPQLALKLLCSALLVKATHRTRSDLRGGDNISVWIPGGVVHWESQKWQPTASSWRSFAESTYPPKSSQGECAHSSGTSSQTSPILPGASSVIRLLLLLPLTSFCLRDLILLPKAVASQTHFSSRSFAFEYTAHWPRNLPQSKTNFTFLRVKEI